VHRILTGVGTDGQSTVLSIDPIAEVEAGGSPRVATEIWNSQVLPPKLPYSRPKTIDAAEIDVGIAEGAARCIYVSLAPGYEVPMHRTDTYDVAMVIKGEVDLLLEDGNTVHMAAGDVLVMPCTVHGLRAGPSGCVLTGVAFGIGSP
jgi:quercetin dioxygenase-like cupin family protein